MEFVLRCNQLKCRTQLQDQAVVTTCSHVFCLDCSDATGLSQAPTGNRICPACKTTLINADDVVVAGLNPSEDYKTSILSGLSPTIIMECASRGLGFYSYQSSQEIIYQEHLAKSLTDKYTVLSQQMDQLIHDANAQIKALQDKMRSMQEEQANLEVKNNELVTAYRDKSKAQQQLQKLYQSLKAQVMASHVANAAGDEADIALQTAQGDRYVDKLPGARAGNANYHHGGPRPAGRQRYHNRDGSGSSGASGGPQRGGIPIGGMGHSQSQGYGGLGGRNFTGHSVPTGAGTPVQAQPRSRLPVLGGTRSNVIYNAEQGPAYQPSPSVQGYGVGPRNLGGFGFGAKGAKKR